MPSISSERAELLTDFYQEHLGRHSVPVLRAMSFFHLCQNKTLYLGEEELIVGGDIILKVLGLEVSPDSRGKVRSMIDNLVPGEHLRVTVLRGGKILELKAVATPAG